MTVRGGGAGNLSPPSHLPLPSSSVSGMGGMSSVPCARERAELVRAWWVTASGSGVAICGDTGTKLDRSVPAGFETGPARDPGKSPRAGCPGHHHQTFKSGHDVRRASRTPLISPGFCPWRVSCCVRATEYRFPRTCSGAQRHFGRRLLQTPARGPGEVERVGTEGLLPSIWGRKKERERRFLRHQAPGKRDLRKGLLGGFGRRLICLAGLTRVPLRQ